MATELPPVADRIAFAIAVIDSERLLLDAYRADSFDGRRERDRIYKRLDQRLEDLTLLLLERDGITVPDHLDP